MLEVEETSRAEIGADGVGSGFTVDISDLLPIGGTPTFEIGTSFFVPIGGKGLITSNSVSFVYFSTILSTFFS